MGTELGAIEYWRHVGPQLLQTLPEGIELDVLFERFYEAVGIVTVPACICAHRDRDCLELALLHDCQVSFDLSQQVAAVEWSRLDYAHIQVLLGLVQSQLDGILFVGQICDLLEVSVLFA